MNEVKPVLCDLEAKLKVHRQIVRRHKSILKVLDKKPEAFMKTNGRELIHEVMMVAVRECVRLETAIIEFQNSLGQKAPKRRATDARL